MRLRLSVEVWGRAPINQVPWAPNRRVGKRGGEGYERKFGGRVRDLEVYEDGRTAEGCLKRNGCRSGCFESA
jgi:hypothetical protein